MTKIEKLQIARTSLEIRKAELQSEIEQTGGMSKRSWLEPVVVEYHKVSAELDAVINKINSLLRFIRS